MENSSNYLSIQNFQAESRRSIRLDLKFKDDNPCLSGQTNRKKQSKRKRIGKIISKNCYFNKLRSIYRKSIMINVLTYILHKHNNQLSVLILLVTIKTNSKICKLVKEFDGKY